MTALINNLDQFVRAYVECFNVTEAAIRCGVGENEAPSVGLDTYMLPDVQLAIKDLCARRTMSAEEVLARYSRIAASDAGDFLTDTPVGVPDLDLTKARRRGTLGTIKKVTYGRAGNSIEWHSTTDALEALAKHYGLFGANVALNLTAKELEELTDAELDELYAKLARSGRA